MINYGRAEVLTEQALKRGWTRGAELGLWDGRTLFYLLDHCPDLHMIGVDVFKDIGLELYSDQWDHDGFYKAVCEGLPKYKDRAIVMRGLTVKAAEFVKDMSLDFVFIDADHTSDGVRADIEAWLPKVRAGGVMAGHDIDWPTVRCVVTDYFPTYLMAKDNVWMQEV